MRVEPIYVDIETQPVIATLIPNIERNFIDIFSYGFKYYHLKLSDEFFSMFIFYFLLIFCIIWEFYRGNENSKIAFAVLIPFFWLFNFVISKNMVYHFLSNQYDKINLLEHINYIKNNNDYIISYEIGVGDEKREKSYKYKCRDESLIETDNIIDNTLIFLDVHYRPTKNIRIKIANDKNEFSNHRTVKTNDSGIYYKKYIIFVTDNELPFFVRNGNIILFYFYFQYFL